MTSDRVPCPACYRPMDERCIICGNCFPFMQHDDNPVMDEWKLSRAARIAARKREKETESK